MQRLLIKEIDVASELLCELSEGLDGGDRLMVSDDNIKEACEILELNEIDFDII